MAIRVARHGSVVRCPVADNGRASPNAAPGRGQKVVQAIAGSSEDRRNGSFHPSEASCDSKCLSTGPPSPEADSSVPA